MRHRATLTLLLLCAPLAAATDDYVPLPAERIAALKKKPCTFVHVWASWCTPCVQELPDLLRKLVVTPGVHPVVIDVSIPETQDSFSRGFLSAIGTGLVTYRKPKGKDEPYVAAVDAGWNGALPFSALYHLGRERKRWKGAVDLGGFAADVAAHCADRPKGLK